MKSVSLLVLGAAALGMLSSSALAASRTFVSGAGNDSGTCGLAAPCRTFAYAITQTGTSGEIVILDSAGYGPVTITQSVTISNPGGVEAGITVGSGQNGITISATSAASVTLRGLTLLGGGVAANGIVLNSSAGGSLNLINCIVKDFTANGIAIQPSAGILTVLVSDSYVLQNGSAGLDIAPTSSGTVRFSIVGVKAKDNANGIYLDASASSGKVAGVVSGSHADSNSSSGITALGRSGYFNVYVQIKDSYASGNLSSGIAAQNTGLATGFSSGAGIVLDDVYVLANGVDILTSQFSSIFTFGNNVYGSTSGATPTAVTMR